MGLNVKPSSIFSAYRATLGRQAASTLLWSTAKWAAFLAYAFVKLTSPADKSPIYTGDGRVWAKIGEAPLFSEDFWLGERPFVLPLISKLLGHSDADVIWFQCLLAIAAAGCLADSLSRLVPRKLFSSLLFVAVLGFSLSTNIHGWDSVFRSESVSTSFLFLLMAATLHWLRRGPLDRRGPYWFGAVLLSGVGAAFARDSNAYILPMTGVLLVLGHAWLPPAEERAPTSKLPANLQPTSSVRRAAKPLGAWLHRHRWGLGAALGLLLIMQASSMNVRTSLRYQFSLKNVIFARVLTNPEKLAYFRDELGMPTPRGLLRFKKKSASVARKALRKHEFDDFVTWLAERGYRDYQRYLIGHPELTWREAQDNYPGMLKATFPKLARRSSNAASDAANTVFMNELSTSYPYWFTLAVVLGALPVIVWGGRGPRLLGLFAVFCVAVGVTQAYIIFHADAMEVNRHALMVGAFVRLGSAVTSVVLLNQLLNMLSHAAIWFRSWLGKARWSLVRSDP